MREGFEIVDVHNHVLAAPQALDAQSPDDERRLNAQDYEREELNSRLEVLDRNGIDQAVVIPTPSYLRSRGLEDTKSVNDAIAAYRDRLPERFPAAVGILEPLYGHHGFGEVDRLRDELGIVGASFHTRHQGVSVGSPLVEALIKRMAQRNLVPFVHALGESTEEALWKVQNLARLVPDTTIVVLDCFATFDQSDQALATADVSPNLVFDTALCYSYIYLERFVANFGAERLVFGSDLYSNSSMYRRSHVLEQLLESGMDGSAKKAIFAGNIRRILGLGGTSP